MQSHLLLVVLSLLLLIVPESHSWTTTTTSVQAPRGRQWSFKSILNVAAASATDVASLTPVSTSPLTMENNENDMMQDEKVGILLLNLGGPETKDDVEGFLFNLFADPDIIRLPKLLTPFQQIIAYIISKRRAPASKKAYESIGGGSPILEYSTLQGKLLCEKLSRRLNNVSFYIGMRYWHPFTHEALEQIRRDEITALVIVPLYPQFSISTSGSSLRVLQQEFSKLPPVHTVVPSWYKRNGYITTMTTMISNELKQYTQEQKEQAKQLALAPPLHVLFSAHGVPQSYIAAGDPYQRQMEECVELISNELYREFGRDVLRTHLSYQSRVGPVEWLRPYTDDVLVELGESEKVINLVVVPISFVSEHIETLEEIDMEYKELAYESGIVNWRRCPALNTHPLFIQDMANMVVEALGEPMQTVTEVCVNNNCGGDGAEDLLLEERLKSAGVQVGIGSSSSESTTSIAVSEGELLQQRERLTARLAMAGVAITILLELFNGKSMTHLFGM